MLGDVIKQARLRAGLTQAELARLVGVGQTYLSSLEKGKRTNPSKTVLEALARALHIPADQLLQPPCEWDAEMEAEVEARWAEQSIYGDFTPESERIIKEHYREGIRRRRERLARERQCAEERPPYSAAG